MADFRAEYLADIGEQFAKLRGVAERAMAQVADEDFTCAIDPENNSIAITSSTSAGICDPGVRIS